MTRPMRCSTSSTVMWHAADQIAEHIDFLVVEAAGGLVEQQDLWIGCERTCELNALLGAEGQARDRGMSDVLKIEIGKDLMRPLVDAVLAFADPGELHG